MNRRQSIVLSTGAALAVAGVRARASGECQVVARRFTTGSFADRAEFDAVPQADDADVVSGSHLMPITSGLPAAYRLPFLPPVLDQCGLAACEAHAFGYGLCGYTASLAGRDRQRFDMATPRDRPSPAWLFKRQLRREGITDCSRGSHAVGYLDQHAWRGAPTEADVPYKDDCAYVDGLDVDDASLARYEAAAGTEPLKFVVGSYRATRIVPANRERGTENFRRLIRNGHAIAFSGPLYDTYDTLTPTLTRGVFDGTARLQHLNHGQLIVGYDDTVGGIGAFLVQNSWSAAWPNYTGRVADVLRGRVWFSYRSFFASQKIAAIAYARRHGPPGGTPLAADRADAPAATIANARITRGHLALFHEFASPVRMNEVIVDRPNGKGTARLRYGTHISNGYTVFRAGDFVPGPYGVRIFASVEGRPIRYEGRITV